MLSTFLPITFPSYLSQKLKFSIHNKSHWWTSGGAAKGSLPPIISDLKLHCIQDRASRIVNPRTMTMLWDIIEKTRNTRVAIDVFKSLHNLLPKGLNSYFKIHHHKINTRDNGSYVFLPKMRTETGKKSFVYQGACIYSRLEKSIREETSILLFKKKLELSKTLQTLREMYSTLVALLSFFLYAFSHFFSIHL